MKLIIETVNDCCEKIKAECTPVEWLIIDKALKMMAQSEDAQDSDKMIAERLIATSPIETMDCFMCGGKDTVEYKRSKYNGHKRGRCNACGMTFIE